ncbi:MAG: dihydropteroate synthase [Pseudomonadota bacterium]|nr:dihydropteroate synthase [Pseudomonadota bacterium]
MNLDELFGGASAPSLDCAGKRLSLDRPRIMGILNLTPDSFSDGGGFDSADKAIAHALTMVEQGADLIDVGGESTRPDATPVSVEEELDRVIPVIEALATRLAVPISIDTSKPDVMRAAVAAGAGMINDVRALRVDGAMQAAVALGVPICLMHMQGEPQQMQIAPHYEDVIAEVKRFLADRVFAAQLAGIDKKRLLLDPGFGFGKSYEHNLALLARLRDLCDLDQPLLVGVSRKRMIGTMIGREAANERVIGSAAAALIAAQSGAAILRVHDVAATRDALAVLVALAPFRKNKTAASSKAFGSARWEED